MRTQRERFRLLRLVLLLLVLTLLTSGCEQFFPYDKEAVQVCGPVTPIYADTDSTRVIGYAQLCYTDYR